LERTVVAMADAVVQTDFRIGDAKSAMIDAAVQTDFSAESAMADSAVQTEFRIGDTQSEPDLSRENDGLRREIEVLNTRLEGMQELNITRAKYVKALKQAIRRRQDGNALLENVRFRLDIAKHRSQVETLQEKHRSEVEKLRDDLRHAPDLGSPLSAKAVVRWGSGSSPLDELLAPLTKEVVERLATSLNSIPRGLQSHDLLRRLQLNLHPDKRPRLCLEDLYKNISWLSNK
jgi:hypothetical protein